MRNAYKISTLIIGCIIGAGFASGKEIVTFFVKFGDDAYALALACGVLFFFGFLAVLGVCERIHESKTVRISDVNGKSACEKVHSAVYCENNDDTNKKENIGGKNISDFNRAIFGKISFIGTIILIINNFLVAAAMLGAMDVLTANSVFAYGGLVSALATLIVLLFDTKGLTKLNMIAVPLIIVMTVIVCVFGLKHSQAGLFLEAGSGGVLMMFLYFGMNMLTLGGALCEFSLQKKERILAATFAGVIITALLMLEIFTIRKCGSQIVASNMPMLAVADSVGLGVIARIVLTLGIFTTLTTSVHVNRNYFAHFLGAMFDNSSTECCDGTTYKKDEYGADKNAYDSMGKSLTLSSGIKFFSLLGVLAVCWAISKFGFVSIVTNMYPLLGGLGLVIVLAVLIYHLRQRFTNQHFRFRTHLLIQKFKAKRK